MNILVTGGAGFIGSNFIRHWLKNHPKDKVVNFDKLTYAGHLSSTKDFKDNKNYIFIKGDITKAKEVNEAMKGIDYVVHFAAESHVDRSIIDPTIFLKTNVLGTQVLINAALKNKVKRFHHVSTDEVFGSLELNSSEKFNEKTPYNPHSPYSASKAASDHLVRAAGDTFGLPYTITNCSNNFGPYLDPEKFIPRHIIRFLNKQKATIYGDGKYTRDWLYVIDHCRAIELVLLKGRVGETYCVGSQIKKDYPNIEVVKMLLKLTGLDGSYIEFVKDRAGHDRRYAIDWTKINKELGWKPEYDFETYLEKTVDWYKQNKWWWQPLIKRAESIYKILLLKRAANRPFAPNKYTGVGGLVDEGESIIDSAHRELQEETGIQGIELHGFASYKDPDYEMYYFTGYAPENWVLECNEGDVEWVEKENIFSKDLIPDTKKVLEEWKKRNFKNQKPFTIHGYHLKGNDSLMGVRILKIKDES